MPSEGNYSCILMDQSVLHIEGGIVEKIQSITKVLILYMQGS